MTVKPSYDELAQALRTVFENTSPHEHQGVKPLLDKAWEVLLLAEAAPSDAWQPIATTPPDGHLVQHVNVRSVSTYRYLPYKPDGRRQMKADGRWQIHTGYGWTNAPLPEGAEWTPARSVEGKTPVAAP